LNVMFSPSKSKDDVVSFLFLFLLLLFVHFY
jgi:hypothetical protein